MSSPECRRNALFYVLYPFMALYAFVNIPLCMLFALGDLTEEPNNHLVVARKPATRFYCVTPRSPFRARHSPGRARV